MIRTLTFSITLALSFGSMDRTFGQSENGFVSLFNGKDLTGWVNVNTGSDTWTARDGLIVCSGKPIGVIAL